MKILKIRLQNIQSLYGEHEIDLTKSSFLENPLFLITGDTGGGKTTILDAITLALYSRTTRHGNEKAESLAESVMSRNTTECFAEVEFEVNGKQYKSRWESDRRFNRKLDVKNKASKPEMMLVNLEDNTDNRSKKQEVLEEIERITQLDFEQFLRSVMLAQGEFTRFLKAKPKERAELLEKMTGTEIYQQISAKVFEKYKQESNILDNFRQQIEQIQILSPEEIEAKNFEKNTIQEQIKALETQILQIEPHIAILQNLEKINKEIAELRKNEQKINDDFLLIQPQLEALQWHEKAMEFEKELLEIGRLQKQVQEQEQKLQNIQTNQKKIIEQTHEAQQAYENQYTSYQRYKSEKAEKEKIILERLIPLELAKQQSIQEINSLQNEKEAFETELKNFIKKNNLNYTFAKNLQEVLKKIEENTQKLQLVEQEIEGKKDIKTLQNEHKQLYEHLLYLQKWQSEAQRLAEKKAELSNKLAENQQDEKKLEQAHAQCQQDSQEIAHLESQIDFLRVIVEQEKLIATYEKQRQHLHKGEPCPLCGSTHHPFAENLPPNQLSEHQEQLQNTQKKLKQLREQLQKNPKQALEARLQQRNQEITKLQAEIKEIEQKILAENITEEILPQLIDQNKAQLAKVETELEIVQNLDKKIAYLQSEGLLAEKEKELWTKKNNIANKQKQLDETEQNILAISPKGEKSGVILENLKKKEEELAKNTETLQKKLQSLQSELQITKQNILLYSQEISNYQAQYEHIIQEILPQITAKGFADIADLQAKMLAKNIAQNYRKQQEKLKNDLQNTKIRLESKINEKNKLSSDLPQAVSLDSLQKQKAEILAEKDELTKNLGQIDAQIAQNETERKKAETLRKKIEQQEQILKTWGRLNQLIGSAKGDKFREFAQSLTLQRLVDLANSHLLNLNKRYRIRKAEAKDNTKKVEEEGLDLEIIDQEQADTARPIESLSGGESFLVSLSLALGLSDLASKNVKIDTLFIDEGFGTLDENTLDTAVDALEALQHKGKTIGIISHVKELKGRIKQQIKVKKIGAGKSTIELPH